MIPYFQGPQSGITNHSASRFEQKNKYFWIFYRQVYNARRYNNYSSKLCFFLL